MTGNIRIKSPWMQLGIVFLVFSPQLFILVLSLFVMNSDLAEQAVTNYSPNKLKLLQATNTMAFFLLPAFLYVVLCFRKRYTFFLGMKKPQLTNMYILAGLCIIFSFPVVSMLGSLNQAINLPEWMVQMEKSANEQVEATLKVNSPIDLIINLIVVALIPAICEELFFRGALQRVLIHCTKSPWAGIIITSILFSALHLQFQGFLPRLFMGVVMGALYWYSGSIWTSILAHFIYNGIQVVAVGYAPELVNDNTEIPMLAGIACSIAVWAIIWYYRKQSTITYAKVYGPDDLTPANQFIA